MGTETEPGRDALVYEPSRVSWALAKSVAMPPSSLARSAVYLTLMILFGALVFAHLTTVTITVKGVGMVRTSAKMIPVRTETAGRIAVLSVRDGHAVKKGQVLIELEDQLDEATVATARELIARLDRLVESRSSVSAMQEAQAVAQEPMRLDVAQLVRERAALSEAVDAFYQALRAVYESGDLSRADRVEREAAVAKIAKIRKEGLTGVLANELRDLETTVARLNVSIGSRRDPAMRQVGSARATLAVQVRAFEQALHLHSRSQQVLSPADGIAHKVAVSGAGELLSAGQTLLEIIPDGGELIAEVQVANRDIGELSVGMPVQMKVEALPYHDFGTLPGRIREIPPDATRDPQGGPATYLIRVALDRTALDAGQGARPVMLGMVLLAEVEIRHRTLLELALYEVLKLEDVL